MISHLWSVPAHSAGVERARAAVQNGGGQWKSGAGARALQDLSAPRWRGWNTKRLGVRNAVPLWPSKPRTAGANGKAALARARSKTCRPLGGADATRSVLECGTQFRFGRQNRERRGPMEKRRWRARAPRPAGPSVARMEHEESWSAERSSALAVKYRHSSNLQSFVSPLEWSFLWILLCTASVTEGER